MKNKPSDYSLLIRIAIATTISVLVGILYDWLTAIIVWTAYTTLVIIKEVKKKINGRKDNMKIDRSAAMKEAQREIAERVFTGKAKDRKEAQVQLKQEGFWTKLIERFRKPTSPTTETPKTEPPKNTGKIEAPKKPEVSWNFNDDDSPEETFGTTIEDAQKAGKDYAAIVETVLATGTTNWVERVMQLNALNTSIQETVKRLQASYTEIRHERVLVENLARLKQKKLE